MLGWVSVPELFFKPDFLFLAKDWKVILPLISEEDMYGQS